MTPYYARSYPALRGYQFKTGLFGGFPDPEFSVKPHPNSPHELRLPIEH